MRFPMPLTRRLALPLIATLFAAPVLAQGAYPDKPITVVVPQGAGGANDAIARIVVQKLATVLKQSVVIDNRPGAGGNIGTAYVAKAKPDGYTLVLTTNSAHVVNPWLYKNIGFDPVKDFAPIGTVATAGYVLVANPAFPANSVKELIARVKAAPPGSISYASAGNGTLNHLLGEMLDDMAGIRLRHVPYKGVAPALNDVLGGQLPIVFASLPSALPHVRSGKLRALAVSGAQRSPALPDVPAIAESVPGYNGTLWIGLFAPTGLPADVQTTLQDGTRKALAMPDLREKLEQQGVEIAAPTTPEQFAALLQTDLSKWARIVKSSGAAVD